jgi:hypothetical protein
MARFMSVALTEQAVRERRKTVTRRLGWDRLRPGDRLTLVRKSMGRRRRDGTVEPLVRIADVEVVHVCRLPLDQIADVDVIREGFDHGDTERFIAMFCHAMRCTPKATVTRIEWRYLDDEVAS